MKKTTYLLALAGAALLSPGCGNEGFLVRPVSLDQRLQETVLQRDSGWWVRDKIALVDVTGLIVNERPRLLFGEEENPVSLLAEKLQAAQADPDVKSVVLRISSPGGTVQASELMHGLVERFKRDSGKPVVVWIDGLAASGGYYLACTGGKIISQSTALTGSIGVIVQTVSFAGTMQKIGMKADAIVSGPYKDMGSPLKDLPDAQREVFQGMVDEFYGKFLEVVAKGRPKLSRENIKALADGRVYTGSQALANGLVDQLGDMQDAVEEARSAGGCKGKPVKVVRYCRPLEYRPNVYSSLPPGGPAPQVNLINLQVDDLSFLRRPAFLYLWSTDLGGGVGK